MGEAASHLKYLEEKGRIVMDENNGRCIYREFNEFQDEIDEYWCYYHRAFTFTGAQKRRPMSYPFMDSECRFIGTKGKQGDRKLWKPK
jgi:hypothetical protein